MVIKQFIMHDSLFVLFQVIAFICGMIVIVLLTLALFSSDWLMAEGWRQGLFSHCIGDNPPTPLPFNVQNLGPDCYEARDAGISIIKLLILINIFNVDF